LAQQWRKRNRRFRRLLYVMAIVSGGVVAIGMLVLATA